LVTSVTSRTTLVTYSQSALGEIDASTSRTNCWASVPDARPLVSPNESNMTPTTDILIIEDDAIMREALAEWLAGAGYGVRKAADGTTGLAAVKFAAPALVVTDIHMPGTSGAMVIAELKQRYPEIPVIAISCLFNSGHGMDADAAIALGAARALAKPFKRRELLRVVAALLGSPAE
jgi:CheY-like chemotaxis protein